MNRTQILAASLCLLAAPSFAQAPASLPDNPEKLTYALTSLSPE